MYVFRGRASLYANRVTVEVGKQFTSESMCGCPTLNLSRIRLEGRCFLVVE